MRRRARRKSSTGFTMIELLIASAVATTLITLLYTTLVWYSRSFQREDENLERSKRAQEVLGLFRDDLGRAAGELKVEDVPLDALKESGWEGNAADFASAPREAVNQVTAWTGYGATSPYVSKGFKFSERWEPGKTGMAWNANGSGYGPDAPAEALRRIAPRSAPCVWKVGVPPEKPQSEWILIRRESAGNGTIALWAFHRVKRGKWAPGALLRHSAATGMVRVGGPSVADFTVSLAQDWMFVDGAPPAHPEPDIRLLATLAHVELRFAQGAEASAVLLMGP